MLKQEKKIHFHRGENAPELTWACFSLIRRPSYLCKMQILEMPRPSVDYVGMLNGNLKCDNHREASPIFPPNFILVVGRSD